MEDWGSGYDRRLAGRLGTADQAEASSGLVLLAVRRAQAGDRSAFAFLYTRFSDDVCRYATSVLRNRTDAEDVTQQVFTKLFSQIGKYEQREVPFLAWMLRVTRNVALDHVRRNRAIPVAEVRLCDERSASHERAQTPDLIAALATLPHAQREVLMLRHLAGLSPGEIARHTGRSEASIHGLHHRGRKALTAELFARGVTPLSREQRRAG
jgi:RNA polymerase sigma-70 factor (ECF subfamily)